MKITVEIDDFWMESDDTLSNELNKYVKDAVIREVHLSIQDKVKREITEQVINEVRLQSSTRIAAYIDSFVADGVLHKGSTNEVSIKDFLYASFTNTRQWENLLPSIKKVAENFTIEIKNRYDLVFAAAVLNNLKENNLLSNDAVKALFNQSGNDHV